MKLWILTISLGLGAVIQSGCGGNTIRVVISPDRPEKLILNPQLNDVIEWQAGVNPSFRGPTPCNGGQPQNNKCTVNQTSGKYLYQCDNNACTDPEVVVGSDMGGLGTKQTRSVPIRTANSAQDVSLWCNNNQVALDPNPVAFTAKAGDTLETVWVNTGSNPIKNWQVKFNNPSPCKESQIGPDHNSCSFDAPASSASYTYAANSTTGECGGTTASGTINVTIQAPSKTTP
ncbi:MAG: hypothetical protein ABSH09_27915 [Bryobacteraceae bacterium]|jgi:hypothetical protein